MLLSFHLDMCMYSCVSVFIALTNRGVFENSEYNTPNLRCLLMTTAYIFNSNHITILV